MTCQVHAAAARAKPLAVVHEMDGHKGGVPMSELPTERPPELAAFVFGEAERRAAKLPNT